jgi:hypothetical protein
MTDIIIPKGSPFVHFDRMAWPIPGGRLRDLEHTLRYARKDYCFDMQERLLLAAVANAYIQLVWQTQKRRNEIAANLFTAAQND